LSSDYNLLSSAATRFFLEIFMKKGYIVFEGFLNMNILITAGGTSEKIDNVRSISNMSSGKLGSLIAEAFAACDEAEHIDYVCGEKALRPKTDKAAVIPVESVYDLRSAVTEICAAKTIHAVIHSMAVSDYTVGRVSTSELISENIASQLESELLNLPRDRNVDAAFAAAHGSCLRETISEAVKNPPSLLREGKISSNVDDLIIFMERTPKILSLYHDLAPEAVLVGFKLLDGVDRAELLDAAYRLLRLNHCHFVLANDLTDIRRGRHTGFLMDESGRHTIYHGKEEIARGILRNVLTSLSLRQLNIASRGGTD
jgi:phosphopantothenate-cysteine ligase